VKLGFHFNKFDYDGGAAALGPTVARIAQAADEAGFDSIALADHAWQSPWMGGREQEMLECYTALGFLAGQTERAKLLALVSGVHFRHPAMLVKAVTTLDVLSGGRAWLGIGTGHDEEEAGGLGIPFPPMSARNEQLEETLQIALRTRCGCGAERRATSARSSARTTASSARSTCPKASPGHTRRS
jgi:alkanesulfonate monooxygenase SsuD/methylene tetrahydromethanopterin reductase-like flavin-dependent oxidoreductase (luciferase family)